jgi:hypothetical protein
VDIVLNAGSNYPNFIIKNIELENGKTTSIVRTCDFTNGQGIYGIITDNKNKQPINDITVEIYHISKSEYYITSTNKKGLFRFGGISSGKYKIVISYSFYYSDLSRGFKEYEITNIVNIGTNEIREYNKSFSIDEN